MFRKTINNYQIAILLFFLTLLVYFLSYNGEGRHWNYFIVLADAFLDGRLYLLESVSWLNELILWQGKYYVVYPPMPAIFLMPLVFLFGTSFPQPYLSIFVAAANVSLSYLVFEKLYKKQIAVWLSILYGFGTMQWYHAEVGSAWYIAHIIALFFLWLMLLEVFSKQRLWLIGLLIGAAYLSRLPAILAAVFVITYCCTTTRTLVHLHNKFGTISKHRLEIYYKNLILFGIGLSAGVLINWGYNYLRFGTVEDISYRLLPVFNEPWYQGGLFNISNIPIHLTEIFTALPTFSDKPPYIIPSLNVLALWFVTPALLLIPVANFKNKLVICSMITVIVMSLPGLMHGSNGFTQFGFRFALDFLPFLLIIVGDAINKKTFGWAKFLISLSILVNLWGVIMLSFLRVWVL